MVQTRCSNKTQYCARKYCSCCFGIYECLNKFLLLLEILVQYNEWLEGLGKWYEYCDIYEYYVCTCTSIPRTTCAILQSISNLCWKLYRVFTKYYTHTYNKNQIKRKFYFNVPSKC